MKAVIKWTLWQRRWSIFWWSLASFGLIFVNMIFYPTFKDQADELMKSFENLPETTLQFIGGSADFFSPVGFANSQVFFIMLPLLLGILAISLGGNLLAREEQDKTIEALLARPISRARLLTGKAVAGMFILAVVSVVSLVTVILTALMVDLEISTTLLAATTGICFLLALSFGAIAFALTSIGRARVAAVGVATLVALGGYIINSLASTITWLKWPSKLLPFHYYQSEAALRNTYEWANLLSFLGIIIICLFVSWLSFRRRDIS